MVLFYVLVMAFSKIAIQIDRTNKTMQPESEKERKKTGGSQREREEERVNGGRRRWRERRMNFSFIW